MRSVLSKALRGRRASCILRQLLSQTGFCLGGGLGACQHRGFARRAMSTILELGVALLPSSAAKDGGVQDCTAFGRVR